MEPCTVVAVEHVSLDGVYQAPARADEDERGDFRHGGWSTTTDAPETTQAVIAKYMEGGWRLLAGRRTYEDLYEGWQVRQPENPMTQALANVQKFVASRDPGYQPAWQNSTLLAGLDGQVTDRIAQLKADGGVPLIVFGGAVLVRSLMQRALLDELVLMTHPVVLGQGRRFFDDAPFTAFRLVDQLAADTGVVVATYRVVSR
jgi:dihydrofolate reductase